MYYNVRHAKNGHLEDKKMEKSITIRLGTEETEMIEKIAEKMQKKRAIQKNNNIGCNKKIHSTSI